MNLPDVIVKIKTDAQGLVTGIETAKKSIGGLGESAKQASGHVSVLNNVGGQMVSVGNSLLSFATKSALAMGTATAAVVGFGIKSATEMQDLRVSFDVLTGSAEKGAQVFQKLNKMGASTPFETKDLAAATKTMLSFGLSTEQTLQSLQAIGDISMGNAGKLQGLSLAFAQVQSTGHLMGQDLLQMINNGFNPLTIISEKTGKSVEKLKKEMADGGISAEMVSKAFQDATQEGALFYKGMEKGSKTFNGTMSTLQDTIGMTVRSIVGLSDTGDVVKDGLFDKASKAIVAMTDWLVQNKDAILDFANNAIKTAVEWGGKLYDQIVKVVDWLKNHKEVVIAFSVALGLVVAVFIAAAAAAAVAESGIVILVSAAVAAIGFLVSMAMQHFGGTLIPLVEKTFSWFQEMWKKYGEPTFKIIEAAFKAAVTWFQENWGTIEKLWTGIWNQIKGTFEVVWGAIQVIQGVMMGIFTGKWDKAWALIKKGFGEIWDGIKNIVSGAWDQISNSFKLFVPLAIEWGKHLIQNFIDGIKSYIGNLANSISGVVKTVKGLLGFSINPNLPSEEWGVHMIENFIGGVKKTMPGLRNSLQGVIGTISGFGVQAASPIGGSSSGIGTTINISMAGANIPSAAAGQEYARLIGDQLVKVLKNQIRI